jgi:hypothetical protein
MVPRARWRFAALAACCVALAGCGGGGGSDEDQVREVVQSFVDAGNEKDPAAACELLARQQLRAVRKLGGSCPEVVAGLLEASNGGTSVTVDEVRIEGNRATADVTVKAGGGSGPGRSSSLLLVREDGEWRLASGF